MSPWSTWYKAPPRTPALQTLLPGVPGTSGSAPGQTTLVDALDWKSAVRMATAAALPAYTRTGDQIVANAVGALPAIDGVAPVVGDRILLKDGAAGADNGIYDVTTLGDGATAFVLLRSSDMDADAEITPGLSVRASDAGTVNGGMIFRLTTTGAITLNVTALAFSGIQRGADTVGQLDLINLQTLQRDTWKPAARVATTGALAAYTRVGNVITANAVGALAAIDGIALAAGETLLLKDGAAGADNGLYTVTTLGDGATAFVLTRHATMDTTAKVAAGMVIPIVEGTANGGKFGRLTTIGGIVLNATALTYALTLFADTPDGLAASGQQVANQDFVQQDGWKTAVRMATAVALAAYTRVGNVITANAVGALAAIDGIAPVAGDRILLKDGAAAADNGLYTVTTLGDGATAFVLTRAPDMDSTAKTTSGMVVHILEGTANGGKFGRLTTTGALTLNVTGLTYALTLFADTPDGLAASDQQVANQDFVQRRAWKEPVRLATQAALAAYTRVGNVITANAVGALAAIDGIAPVAGDRILLKNGAAGADNGIYTVTTLGDGATAFVLTRAPDMDKDADCTSNMHVAVQDGTINAGVVYTLTTLNPITLNVTGLLYRVVASQVATFTLVAGAEAANARLVTLNLVDLSENSLNRTQRFSAVIKDANFVTGLVAAWTATIGGGGAAISADVQPSILADTDANGNATILVTDVGGVFVGTVFLVVTPVGQGATPLQPGFPQIISLGFA